MKIAENLVAEYGWASDAQPPGSCTYVMPRILEILKRFKARRVLDIGSGNGALCAELTTMNYDTVGIEYDAKGVAISRKVYPEIPFYCFGVQDDPAEFLANELLFDVVVSTEVIEHLFSPHFLPIYTHKCLKPGGYLVLTTPYHGYLKNLALSVFNKWDMHHNPLWHGGHVKFWSCKTLTNLLEINGFEVIEFSGVGRFPYLWKSMVLVAKKR
jgi:2-polyprenyl-3-methyl-5-hydroxy-6-metoxy-1,4-benzoquinol methylase